MTFLQNYRETNPFMNHCSIDAVSTCPECSEVALTVNPQSLNIHGVVHGGVMLTMADCAAGLAARSDNRDYVTQNLSMNFIRNLSQGLIHARAKTVSRGRTVVIVHVEITDDTGRLLAEGTVNMFCVGQRYGERKNK